MDDIDIEHESDWARGRSQPPASPQAEHDAGTSSLLSPSSTPSDHDADTNPSSSSDRPLSRVVELFMQPLPVPAQIEYHTLRSLLYLLRFGSPTSPAKDPAVLGALDQTQKAVLALLEEWWTGAANDNVMPKFKLSYFVTALRMAPPDQATLDIHVDALNELVFEGDRPFLLDAAKIQRLSFAGGPGGDIPEQHTSSIQTIRQAYSEAMDDVYHRNMDILYSDELDSLERTSYLSNFRQIAADISARERIAWHAMRNSSSMALNNSSKLRDFHRPIPTILDPCCWLEGDQADDLPYYLWDIENGRTVETGRLPAEPGSVEYAIVSHTWGRLRDGDAMESVPGVPWRVPRITRYDVKQLPQMIKDAGFSEPYIWMDLLCIPQETVDWQLKICMAELPRQLAIFRNSSTAAIWLNDIESWENTAPAVAWMGLECLSQEPTVSARYDGLYDVESARDTIARSASNPCDLVKPVDQKYSDDDDELGEEPETSPWFTSLWTLQEIMICPDMIMLDRAWRPLALGTHLITLDSLTSLAGELSVTDESTPKGAATLQSVFYNNHLSLLRMESRLVPLVLGANRVSTSPRAPAIMSAIGATNWFRGQTLQQFESPTDASELVLASYPLPFVNEVRELCGAEFFSCSTTTATLVMARTNPSHPAPGYPLRGTMLPFMPVPAELYQGPFEPSDPDTHDTDHPSVTTWRIQRDGSVIVPTVSVIASNTIHLQTPCKLKCIIWSNNPDSPTALHTAQELMPLTDWIQRFTGEVHALCLSFSEEHMVGILLHRLRETDSFVKAGTFKCGWPDTLAGPEEPVKIDTGFMTVLDVDWHVL
ncbi:hypothetical protein BDW74DRAFT_188147 [Aspergillus multicolor]|uniref:uncharacterized protein n=1 Tax=Aspergillus multicolor TaxID=41759 RepID=UPI003CCE5326